jgi:hypothetical protein
VQLCVTVAQLRPRASPPCHGAPEHVPPAAAPALTFAPSCGALLRCRPSCPPSTTLGRFVGAASQAPFPPSASAIPPTGTAAMRAWPLPSRMARAFNRRDPLTSQSGPGVAECTPSGRLSPAPSTAALPLSPEARPLGLSPTDEMRFPSSPNPGQVSLGVQRDASSLGQGSDLRRGRSAQASGRTSSPIPVNPPPAGSPPRAWAADQTANSVDSAKRAITWRQQLKRRGEEVLGPGHR